MESTTAYYDIILHKQSPAVLTDCSASRDPKTGSPACAEKARPNLKRVIKLLGMAKTMRAMKLLGA